MTHKSRPNSKVPVLATDLDGTLIPLAEHPQTQIDLADLGQLIRENSVTLTFVTGRHLASVQQVRKECALPSPDWIICDVGTTIFRLDEADEPVLVTDYRDHLAEKIAAFPIPQWRDRLKDLKALRLQEEEKQGPFKLSYYTEANGLPELVNELERRLADSDAPYSLIHSIDPFNGDGLVDFLPKGVSKDYALMWWSDHAGFDRKSVVFAGDSGNDTAALTAGYRAIVVGNADRNVARSVYDFHQNQGWKNRLCLAKTPATSGVLEGCRWFELFPPTSDTPVNSLPWGATPVTFNQTHFRVWVSQRNSVQVEIQRGDETESHPLLPDENGFFSGMIRGVKAGDRYRYRLDEGNARPDPVSRFQPNGVHGESQIVDPNTFPWNDQNWRGISKRDLVIYEMHIGAFTKEGTYRAAMEHLPRLKELGITAVELLPVAQTPGRWNWGYDGVNFFAPRNTYGPPDDFKAFVDACHSLGLAVLLDVVYNHMGPEGNYWGDFAPYYSDQHHTPWGDAFAFDGPHAKEVRQFVIENALYWLREYHVDGLRLDAVHCMADDSQPHILDEIRDAVAEFRSKTDREIHLIAEANLYDPALLPPETNRPAYDGVWCDDIMHSIYSVISPDTNVTHRPYLGPTDLAESLQHGFLYSGMPQQRMNQKLRTQLSPNPVNAFRTNFVIAVQNHDNVGNHPHGKRVHHLTSPEHQKAAAALVLLYPAIPLIFMGEEQATRAPFRFFVDFQDNQLRRAVDEGRAREYPDQVWQGAISPSDERAFRESILTDTDDPTMFEWYQSLLTLRKKWSQSGILQPENLSIDCDGNLFLLRYFTGDGEWFIAAHLFPVDVSVPPIHLEIEGEVLLDSLGKRSAEDYRSIKVNTPRALIGRGKIVGSKPDGKIEPSVGSA